VNGISGSGTGQFGQSTSGIGVEGVHSASTGSASGVYGQTSRGVVLTAAPLTRLGLYGCR
jgi:hypothetical protein